jgi:hypothetical protein
MYIKNRAAALIFRVLLLAGCAYGLIMVSGVFQGRLSGLMLAYYTNLSNILCFGYMLLAAVHTLAGIVTKRPAGFPAPLPKIKRAFTLMIAITVVVYHFILAPGMYRMNYNYQVFSGTDILIHYFTPIMFILDWALFDKKNGIRWYEPLSWLIIPVAYLVYVLIRAEVGAPLNALGVRYPYLFLDFDLLEAAQVYGYIALCAAGIVAIGYLFFLLDKLPALFAARSVRKDIDINAR